jgi:hypothetical protein
MPATQRLKRLVIFGALEALVDHVRCRGGTPYTPKPSVRLSPHSEESLGQRLVFGGSGLDLRRSSE